MGRVPQLSSHSAGRRSGALTATRHGGGPTAWTALLVIIVLLLAPNARTQDVTEASLKAAFLYNFARYTQWSQDVLPGTAPLTVCVLNDSAVGDALARTVKGRLLAGRGISVSHVQPGQSLRSCHLLYITTTSEPQMAAIVKSVTGAPVLTVSEFDNFARKGGIVHIFVENGKIDFRIDLDLARRSGLDLSSRLLGLADEVYEKPAGGRP